MESTAAFDTTASADASLACGLAAMEDSERIQTTEKLIAQYHTDVFRYARWLTGCSTAAEDITQEVFLRAFRGIHNLRDAAASKSWLLSITRNEFARWCSKSALPTYGLLAEELSVAEEGRAVLDDVEWVASGMGELPSEFRVVLLLYYFEQLTYAEIAEQLNIPLGTVMSRLSRGRAQLREALCRSGELDS